MPEATIPDRPPPLDDLTTPDREWVARGLNQWGKVQIADRLRRMLDNQRTLNTTLAADRALRDLHQRFNERNLNRVMGGGGDAVATDPTKAVNKEGITYPADDEMGINIDSPTTINYTIPPEPRPPAATPATAQVAPAPSGGLSGFTKGALVTAGVIGLPLVAAGATYLLTRPKPVTTPPPVVAPDHIGGVSLMPPVQRQPRP